MFFKVKHLFRNSSSDFHILIVFQVLLFCLVAYGHGRPSDVDEQDEILREAKKDKQYQQ